MKKTKKKLRLDSEALRVLDRDLEQVVGAGICRLSQSCQATEPNTACPGC